MHKDVLLALHCLATYIPLFLSVQLRKLLIRVPLH